MTDPRKPVDALLDTVEWSELPAPSGESRNPTDGGGEPIPYATHRGELVLDGLTLIVYQLSNGQRVISEESMRPFLEGLSR